MDKVSSGMMAHPIFLSHLLNSETPAFGGSKGFEKRILKAIEKGDSSNSESWQLTNHIGTHIDLPYHFDPSGLKMEGFEARAFFFEKVIVVEHEAQPAELIGAPVFEREQKRIESADLILIKTQFERFRKEPKYWESGPGVSEKAGFYLRERCPSLRAIGFDFLSLTSFQHREEGRAAHRALLGHGKRPPVLIIEDLSLQALSESDSGKFRVVVAPVRVEGADGAPVTVFAESLKVGLNKQPRAII